MTKRWNIVLSLIVASFGSLSVQQDLLAQGTSATPVSNPTVVKSAAPATTAASAQPLPSDTANMEHVALMQLVNSIEPYHPAKELKGTAILSGSTTMIELGKSWAERFKKFHPEVTFTRGADGSEAALKELSEKPNVIAGVSRPLTSIELETLKKGKCKDPLPVIVALDPLALYVHKDNPIAGITPEQLESIFRAPGGKEKHAATWGDLGVSGEWAAKAIRIHSRSEISGTTGFIKQFVVRGAEMARSAEVHDSNEAVAVGIGKDKFGIGISSIGEHVDQVRAVPFILNGVTIPATEQSFLAGKYPFVRPLMIVIDKSSMKEDNGLRESILHYILSRDGQMEAIRAGFHPIDPSFIRKQLDGISGLQLR